MTTLGNTKTLTVIEAEVEEPEAEGAPASASRALSFAGPWRWLTARLKRLIPKGLFARSLIIIVAPVIITLAVVTYIFFQQHWNTVTRRLSESVAGDIAMLIETYEKFPGIESIEDLKDISLRTTKLSIALNRDEGLPTVVKPSLFSVLDRTLRQELELRIDKPFWFDTTRYPRFVDIRVQLDDDVLRILAEQERVFASTGYIFLIWMISTSLVILSIAIIFLRNQLRPIQKLAEAAESFGKGREAIDFKPTGASEVRLASEAFIEMRDRIRRQIDQRTLLLAGVSHDLRTPITRMRLQAALMPKSEELESLIEDLADMEHMLEEYLAFARGQGGEAAAVTDISDILHEIVERAQRSGTDIGVDLRGDLWVSVRRNAVKRCISNLVDNAMDYGNRVAIIASRKNGYVEITVDDDGPGIPVEQMEDAFKPFNRLDESRNLDKGGVGLGLAIAQDVARGHGGELTLSRSPWGGLRALVRLPV